MSIDSEHKTEGFIFENHQDANHPMIEVTIVINPIEYRKIVSITNLGSYDIISWLKILIVKEIQRIEVDFKSIL
jgi:hypothetical protein